MLGEMAKQGGEEARQTSLLCSDCHTAMATVLCCATRLCARHLYCTPHLHHRKQWKVINRSQFNKQNAQAEKVSPGLPRTPNVVSCHVASWLLTIRTRRQLLASVTRDLEAELNAAQKAADLASNPLRAVKTAFNAAAADPASKPTAAKKRPRPTPTLADVRARMAEERKKRQAKRLPHPVASPVPVPSPAPPPVRSPARPGLVGASRRTSQGSTAATTTPAAPRASTKLSSTPTLASRPPVNTATPKRPVSQPMPPPPAGATYRDKVAHSLAAALSVPDENGQAITDATSIHAAISPQSVLNVARRIEHQMFALHGDTNKVGQAPLRASRQFCATLCSLALTSGSYSATKMHSMRWSWAYVTARTVTCACGWCTARCLLPPLSACHNVSSPTPNESRSCRPRMPSMTPCHSLLRPPVLCLTVCVVCRELAAILADKTGMVATDEYVCSSCHSNKTKYRHLSSRRDVTKAETWGSKDGPQNVIKIACQVCGHEWTQEDD